MNHEEILAAEIAQAIDIKEHLRFMRNLALEMRAREIVDLGVRDGFSTVALLCAAAETDGIVRSVEVSDCSRAASRIALLGLAHYWRFSQANDLDWVKTYSGPADLILIDTSHERDHTEAELRAFGPWVRAGGVILLHDTTAPYYATNVLDAIEAFLDDDPEGWRYDHRTNNNGLAVLTRIP